MLIGFDWPAQRWSIPFVFGGSLRLQLQGVYRDLVEWAGLRVWTCAMQPRPHHYSGGCTGGETRRTEIPLLVVQTV